MRGKGLKIESEVRTMKGSQNIQSFHILKCGLQFKITCCLEIEDRTFLINFAHFALSTLLIMIKTYKEIIN